MYQQWANLILIHSISSLGIKTDLRSFTLTILLVFCTNTTSQGFSTGKVSSVWFPSFLFFLFFLFSFFFFLNFFLFIIIFLADLESKNSFGVRASSNQPNIPLCNLNKQSKSKTKKKKKNHKNLIIFLPNENQSDNNNKAMTQTKTKKQRSCEKQEEEEEEDSNARCSFEYNRQSQMFEIKDY